MSEPFIGEIRMVGFNYAPHGWAFCNGQMMSIAQNNALFALLGTTYGGDGHTTFGLPDLRGRSPVGMGDGPGLTNIAQGDRGGAESVSLTTAELPNHAPKVSVNVAIPAVKNSTNVTDAPSVTSILGPLEAGSRGGTLYSTDNADTTLKPFEATATVEPVGGGSPLPIRDPFLGSNFIIALQGIFPPRS